MATYIPGLLRQQIREVDRGCCAYCRTCEANTGIPSSFDHIFPRSRGGQALFENLCQACRPCNETKNDQVTAIDPLTGEMVSLFNPRMQFWVEHFEWNSDSTRIIGLTELGRLR